MANTQSIKIRLFQRKLYTLSKQDKDRRFYSLYDKVYRNDILLEAYYQCKTNRGKPGIDGITFKNIEEQGLTSWIENVSQVLKNRTYVPSPVKRVYIPKPDGGERPLGIPTIRDRVIQTACKIVVEPIFEAQFSDNSYGYRPKRRAADAVKMIKTSINQGFVHVLDADLSGYFDNIPHDRLLDKIARRISDTSILALMRKFLRAPVAEISRNGKTSIKRSEKGTPQGGVISPLFANLYLNDFALLINTRTPCRMISYADDFVIMHKKAFTPEQLTWFKEMVESEGLNLNEKKTCVEDMSKQLAEIDFLGFNFKQVPCFWKKGRWYLKVQPSKKSQKKFRDKIRTIVKHRTSKTMEELIAEINPVIKGWKNYFAQCGYPKQVFFKMDWFVVGRFYGWAKRLSQRNSKCLTPDAWEILKKNGLEFFVVTKTAPVKGKV
ncbi:MAG: group II intron reverse transcriptase/maturase [Fibrobacteria bacterium]|nr:group II intron reverse transcriptase/maturase [Fibrobacteria bacterium]